MAQRVIGLDVGTNAVRAVEVELGDHPQIRRMGQVALPAGAVVDGEVVDGPAVSMALRRLWAEAGFKDRKARAGMSSPRVIVRTIEMPPMERSELISTISLQLEDYVPLSPEDTVFGVRPLDWSKPGPANQELLLAATHREAVEPLLAAMAGADLDADAVDVVPAALALALCNRQAAVDPDDERVDVVVSIGAGTVVVVAARQGEAVFTRTLSNVSGSKVTERLASSLGLDIAEAELHKRAAIDAEESPVFAAAVAELVGEVRASLDFYAGQSDALPIRTLMLTGGGSLLAGLESALRDELGVAVVAADPFADVRMGDTGFEPADLADVAPYVAAAVGVALGASRPKDRRLDLTPAKVRTQSGHGRRALALAAAALVVIGTGSVYVRNRSAIVEARSELSDVQVRLSAAQVAAVPGGGPDPVAPLADPSAVAASVAPLDVDWTAVESAVETTGGTLGIAVASFQGAIEPPTVAVAPTAPTTDASAPATLEAPVPTRPTKVAQLTLTATAPDMNSIAGWLDVVGADPRFVDPWVAGLTMVDAVDGSVVQFTISVGVTSLNLVQPGSSTAAAAT